jgi:primosomal protein N' (replication factor Y)
VTGKELGLVRETVRAARPKPLPEPAAELPVARVAVDVALAHLDRPFDYLVPEPLSAAAVPGVRVRVRFAGQLVNGFVLERMPSSDHTGRLTRLSRVVSPEPVLVPEVARLARLVADRYAGTLADVLRLAVPPRHARVEAEAPREPAAAPERAAGTGGWEAYESGPAFLDALADGRAPRAVWSALPGSDWAASLAAVGRAALAAGRGVLVVVPDARDVARVDTALDAELGPGRHVAVRADLGPAERYRRWLAVRRGAVRAVVGTRAAMFAPIAELGLVVVWDDGDDLHAEPRAPYPHVREVLCLRAHQAGAAALLGGHVRTAEAAALVASGWARSLEPVRSAVRRAAPRVRVTGEDAELALDEAARTARLPSLAWQVAHDALRTGPVLVQVPRRGYLPGLGCEHCRAPARCRHCAGPLSVGSSVGSSVGRGQEPARCGWCGRAAAGWRCPACGWGQFRARVVGALRTAEELGRAFPSVPVRSSGGEGVLEAVSGDPALVVATPGAEPPAAGGYAAALLLDGWVLLARPDLRAGEEAVRRWAGAAALVRSAAAGGTVVLVADPGLGPVQALVRWDPAGFAERELADRLALGFPPAARLAAVTGSPQAVRELLELADLPPGAEVLGPVPGRREGVRALVRVPRAHGAGLAAALRAAQGVRSARKAAETVRVQIDPPDIG